MSRQASDELHTLIRGLSQSEKRYVKLELRKHVLGQTNQSELLFDAIASQKVYSEAKIKAQHGSQPFVRRLPEAKRELLNVILRAMRQYFAERSATRRGISAVQDTDFLRLRGCFHWAQQKMEDALENATLVGNHALRALTLQSHAAWERAQEIFPHPSSSPDQDPVVLEARALLEAAYFEAVSDRMYSIVRTYGRSGGPVAEALAADLQRAGEAHLPITSAAAQSSWLRFLSIKSMFIDNNAELSLSYDVSRLEVLEQNPKARQANIHEWVNLVHSVALRLILLRRFDDARPYRDKLYSRWQESAKGVSPANRKAVAAQYLNIEVQLALQSNNLEDIAPRIPQLDAVLADHESDFLTEVGIAIHNNISLIELGLERRAQALRRIEHLLQYPPNFRPDVHLSSRLLRILLHLDEGNDSVVSSLIRAERRKLADVPISPDQEALLSFAARFFAAAPGTKRTTLLRKTLESVESFYNASTTQPLTAMFEFRAWLRAKLNGTTWREELRKVIERGE